MPTIFYRSDLDLTRFLVEVSTYWRPRKLTMTAKERRSREYDGETDRLLKFIRGQQAADDEMRTA